MTKYFNIRTAYGVETVDELSRADFPTMKEYRAELLRLRREYHASGIGVYTSSRSTKDWRQRT